MLEWLRGITRAEKPIKNSTGVPDEALDLLGKSLAPLDSLKKGLGQRLLRYVVDGEDDEALLALRGTPNAACVVRICYRRNSCPNREIGYRTLRDPKILKMELFPPVALYRLGQVLHAAWSACARKHVRWPHLKRDEEWLEPFVCEGVSMDEWGNVPSAASLSAELIGAALEAGGHSRGQLVNLVLLDEPTYGFRYYDEAAFRAIKGLGDLFAAHPDEVVAALGHPNVQLRAHVLRVLSGQKTPLLGQILKAAVVLSVSAAKTVREAADQLLYGQAAAVKAEAATLIRGKIESGSAAEKTAGIGLLFKLEGDACRSYLEERRGAEKARGVREEIDKYLQISAAAGEEGTAGGYEDCLVVPAAKEYPEVYELPPDVERDLTETLERFNCKEIKAHAECWDRTDPKWRRGQRDIAPPASPKAIKLICTGLKDGKSVRAGEQLVERALYQRILHRELGEFVTRHDLDLVLLIRLGFFAGFLGNPGNSFFTPRIPDEFIEWVDAYRQRQDPDLTLLDLASAFRAAGIDETNIDALYLNAGYFSRFNPLGLSDDAIWPFYQIHAKRLEHALGISGHSANISMHYWNDYKKRAYQLLAMFPRPPKRFAPFLWEQALGTSKLERAPAQACLKNYPGKEKLIIRALNDGRKEVRASAAAWLNELRIVAAVPAIKKALQKEKHDEPKAAMMMALEGLGEDIDKFLNRKKLQEDAEKGLEKGIPAELAWFPFQRLPELHWAKNRQQVPEAVVKWFIVQAFRLKSPEPGPLLRRYFALMRPNERKALGRFVLDCWLAQDTLPKYSQTEAEQLADKQLAQTLQSVKKYPQYYPDFNANQARKNFLNQLLNECLASANPTKGILAVAGACCEAGAVPIVERYLKKWYGHRMAQCKALIQMLSWVEHPLAIQLILSVATRFRTKAIQQEAARYADLIAERNNWTREEMADRTIPNAGFERDGRQTVDYGQRQFTVRLLDDFSIQIENQDGKVVKELPPASKLEDEAEVKEIKKDFSAAKKELQQVLKFQKERLYEAMCLQRQWRYEDWNLYLNSHPIVGRYCQRLVWLAFRDKALAASFRPMNDQSLTDYNDEPVLLEPDDLIQIGHQAFLPVQDAMKWRESLKDYEVESLFEQFGRQSFALDEQSGKETEVKAFRGHLVKSFKLRSRANKLGYTRGQAEDAGWFYTYHKTFPGLKLQAVIQFTGNGLPEEDRIVALESFYFTALREDAQEGSLYSLRPLRLSTIPGVLLSETWNDMKLMADDGSGYDPDWEKKSEY